MRLSLGGVAIREATLAVSCLHDNVMFHLDGAKSGNDVTRLIDGRIRLGDISASTEIEVAIPYTGQAVSDQAIIDLDLNYLNHEGRKCRYMDDRPLFLGLPLTVNVQDFFRPDCLLSQFTIASDGREYLRIRSAILQSPPGQALTVQACSNTERKPLIVSPLQPLSCLYKITHSASHRDPSTVLRLVIEYCSIEEELAEAIRAAIDGIHASSQVKGNLRRAVRRMQEDRSRWFQPYIISLGESDAMVKCISSGLEDVGARTAEIQQLVASLSDIRPPTRWRILEIPVEMPQRRLVVSASYRLATPESTIEGRAITAFVTFRPSFAWAEDVKPCELVFEVMPSSDDWLVLGKKRGFFIAQVSLTKAIRRHGDTPDAPSRTGRLSRRLCWSQSVTDRSSCLLCLSSCGIRPEQTR